MENPTDLKIQNLESASPEQIEALQSIISDLYEPACKAVRTPTGEPMPEAFDEWFLNQLARRATRRFINAQTHIWRVVEDYLTQHGGTFANLTPGQLQTLEHTMFDLGLAHTSHMVGIHVDEAVARRLRRWGWTAQEVVDFPGLAYRFALIRDLISSGRVRTFEEIIRAAMAHPVSEAERQAINIARAESLNLLMPVYDRAGRLIRGRALQREKDLLRGLVVRGIEQRIHPLALARDMINSEGAGGIFRDFERIARTEIASAYSNGAFRDDRASGKFADADRVYRITRPNACKICLSLYTNPDGTPRLYRVRDLERGTTPEIDIGVRVPRLYRAVIGATHPNEMCSDWQKYWGEISDELFRLNAAPYRAGRDQIGLAVQGDIPDEPLRPTGTSPLTF